MWCSTCQQDVPAIASPDESVVCCARCQSPVGATSCTADSTPEFEASPKVASRLSSDAPPLDDWQCDDDLHAAQHRMDLLGLGLRDPVVPGDPHVRQQWSDTKTKARSGRPKRRRSSLVAWCALSLGTMALVFGGVLLGWSSVTDRTDLWRLGMPFALVGQAALVVGLVFQLDGLWRSNREATETLDELDDQLAELRRDTSLLTTTHTGPSQSFYVHLAERASPHLLLADLKGQLDLLAMQLSEPRD